MDELNEKLDEILKKIKESKEDIGLENKFHPTFISLSYGDFYHVDFINDSCTNARIVSKLNFTLNQFRNLMELFGSKSNDILFESKIKKRLSKFHPYYQEQT